MACGGDDGPPPPIAFDAARPDGGAPDADGPPDSAIEDDGSTPIPDGGTVVPGDCVTTDDDRVVLGMDMRPGARQVAVAAGSEGFVALWTANEGGFDDVFARHIPASGAASDVVAITDNFASERAPALVWTGDGFVAGWHDNDGRGFEVVTHALDAMGRPEGSPRTLTTTRMGFVHDSVALARTESRVVAAFLEEDIVAGTRRLQAATLGLDGALVGSVASISDPPAGEPAVAARADGSLVVWARSETEGASVVARPLGADATASAAVQSVSTQTNAAGTVAVAEAPTGALAAVFDVDVAGGGARQEVRFRTLHASTGAANGLETVITPGTSRGRAPGIAAFAGGYAVAFRATADEGLSEPTIRLAFVTINGTVTEVTNLDPTTAEGGPVRIAIGLDGSILIAWAEADLAGTTMIARRLRCGG